jgi:hypothetical protein
VECVEGFHIREDEGKCYPNDEKDKEENKKAYFIACDNSFEVNNVKTCQLCMQ